MFDSIGTLGTQLYRWLKNKNNKIDFLKKSIEKSGVPCVPF